MEKEKRVEKKKEINTRYRNSKGETEKKFRKEEVQVANRRIYLNG